MGVPASHANSPETRAYLHNEACNLRTMHVELSLCVLATHSGQGPSN